MYVLAVPDVSNLNLASQRATHMMQYMSMLAGHPDYAPCCSPTGLQNATILYHNYDGQLITSTVSILVTSCGCI